MSSIDKNGKRETVADIVAEWRNCIESADPSVWNDERIAGLVKTTKAQQLAYLDRLEAAWKQKEQCYLDQIRDAVNMIGHERFVKEHPPVCNAAAVREALANIAEYAKSALCHTEDSHVLGYLAQIENHANAALSAPARNCDVGKSEAELSLRYQKETGNDLGVCSQWQVYVDWLLAPAAEREGEGDGR